MTKISLLISFTSLWHGTRTSTCVSGGVALSLIDLMFLAESGKEVFSPQCSLISSWSPLRWFEQACAMQMTWFCLLLHLKLWGWCCAVVRILLLIAALSSNPPRFRYLLSPVLHLPHALLAFILVVSHFPSWHRFTSWQPSLQSQWCWGYQFQTPWYVKEGQLLTCYLPKSWSLHSNPSLSILLLSSLWLWTLVPPMPCSSEHWSWFQ